MVIEFPLDRFLVLKIRDKYLLEIPREGIVMICGTHIKTVNQAGMAYRRYLKQLTEGKNNADADIDRSRCAG
jgi:hypothetical protein